ncbi:hypothetical protein PROAA_1040004 [Candidatus Propionivibrio aalborgensis]|uniref:Uncharacterized protein n=1 Tax=Candidatus Propionivibrio aalborgensis TaxID=1860101 RepID=A0A1A8XG79_9RHOO|nr:hypothetical protein PROAA_1040004 [Candidatus Propionivibrio aalborgensis]
MTAPVASGWSISPGGVFTHWKAPPLHGARLSGHWGSLPPTAANELVNGRSLGILVE